MARTAHRFYRQGRYGRLTQFAFRRAWDARERRDMARVAFWVAVWIHLTDRNPDGWRQDWHYN